jgi:hypothetical protein
MRRGIGLSTGFIKHSYNTWLHFKVPCDTHALIFLVLVRSHVLSPLSFVASSAESVLFTANSATTVAASAGSLYSPAGTYSLAATAGSRRFRLLHSTSQLNCSVWTNLLKWVSEWMNYDRRSVGQPVLVSSPIWGSWPDPSPIPLLFHDAITGTDSKENTSTAAPLLLACSFPSNGCQHVPYCLQHARHNKV